MKNSAHRVILSIFILLGVTRTEGERLVLTSNGPVTLDAPITFTGSMSGDIDPEDKYKWTFRDNASPSHENITELDASIRERNYTVTFPSSMYDEYEFKMTLTIYKLVGFYFWREVATEEVYFNITRFINGDLVASQNGEVSKPHDNGYIVSSVNMTEIKVNLNDPDDYIKNGYRVMYIWFINDVLYGQTNENKFSYNFSTPGEYTVEATVIAELNTTNPRNISHDEARDLKNKDKDLMSRDGQKMGFLNKRLISKAPLNNFTIVGKQMLKHGELVDLMILCNGTGPWNYCRQIKESGYNVTGNETCSIEDTIQRNICNFSIMWYFSESETYNFIIIISNDVSSIVQAVPVTVYEVARHVPISIVIIPVAASIVVVIILISGIALYSSFKRNLAVEVADFDFNNAESEDLQYKTFWERLRESFGNAFIAHSETESEGSSVSGMRSVQLPGQTGGIGYGTIS